jgi:glucan phosphoethanolaminetransferase (alkaline phosphatase superfamily)
MTVNGLPLHPLVVHAAVVLAPLAGLGAVAYLVPRFRHWLRWPLLVTGVLAAVVVWFAAYTGGSLKDSAMISNAMSVNPALAHAIQHHEDLAGKLQASTWTLGGLIVLLTWFHSRPGWIRTVLTVLVPIAGVVAIVLVVLTGDAGAKAVWGS